MESSTLLQWLSYLERIHSKSIDLSLSRIIQVAETIQIREFDCPVIMVGGTNGKGSCVHCLEAIYLSSGYRVGSYTSPHLHYFNERIKINGQNVNDELLVAAFQEIEIKRKDISLTFFEFTTLAALLIFKSLQLDVIILEVGLGGRLDAVNIVEPDLSIITSIDLDHTDWLGSNREAIGYEKAGIMRSNKSIICGDDDPPKSLLQRAKELNAPLFQFNQHYGFENHSYNWTWFGLNHKISNLPPISIRHQNASSSLMAIQLLAERLPVTSKAIMNGLKAIKIPGRFELWQKAVTCIFDVAHNPQAGRWLAEQLKNSLTPGKKIAVVGMLADKDISQTLAPLLSIIDDWHPVTLNVARGADSKAIVNILTRQGIKNWYNHDSVDLALQTIMNQQDFNKERDLIIIFGSFFTVAAAQKFISHI